MKYSELIQFEPLETIVELKEANKEAGAKHLVETFVISRQMSQWLCDTVMPILRFDQSSEDVERLGIFIVGNYGTGKSHLMSLISAVAEREELVSRIQEEDVRSAAAGIAGKYKVVRIEIGASKMTLRDIITRELEEHLSGMGIKFEFPPADKVISNKTDLEDMMSAFHKKYPDHGLFVVVDELLDYLGTRKDMELRYDLSMLRELGEASKNLRFRFIALTFPTLNHVQNSIF